MEPGTYTYIIIIGAAVIALAAIATVVNNVISIIRNVRRDPPLPEEVAKGYATKHELAELRQELKDERSRVDAILKQQFDLIRNLTETVDRKVDELESSIKSWQLGIERLIGKIEGKVESK